MDRGVMWDKSSEKSKFSFVGRDQRARQKTNPGSENTPMIVCGGQMATEVI